MLPFIHEAWVLIIGYLTLVSLHFYYLITLAYVMSRVLRPPWGHGIRYRLRQPLLGQVFGIWLIFRYHHAFFSGRHLFDVWIRFSYGFGWLGSHIWWWMIWCHLIFWHTAHLMPYWGTFRFSWDMESHDPHHLWDACWVDGLLLSYHDPLVESLLGHSVGLTLLIFRYHHAFSSRRRLFDVWIRFNCGYGWLGLRIWWWVIQFVLIFQPTIHLMLYWGIFPLQLRFIDLHGFTWSSPFMRYILNWWSVFISPWFIQMSFS